MGQDKSKPALTVKVVTLSLIVKETTCAEALQRSAKRGKRGNITYRTSERFLELPTIVIRGTFSPIENYRKSGRFFREHRHLSSVTYWEHPGGSLDKTNIWVWSITWNWKTYRTSGSFLDSANISVRHLSGIGKPAEHPWSFTLDTFVASTTLCIHFFPLFCWTSWIDTQHFTWTTR